MGKGLLLVAALSSALAPACAQHGPPDPTGFARAMLTRSADAWNRRDLEAFIGDYAPESTTTFVSGGHVQHGFDWIRQNYAPTFAPGGQHDSLRFEEVAARRLGGAYLLATARYVLFRGDSVTSRGPFTLILRRTGDQWKIVHDHTSRD